MAINLDDIRNRLNQIQNKSTERSNLWKPQPGKTTLRMLPYLHNKDNPFIELYFHYGLNGKTFLSPTTFGRPDPVAEFADQLKSTGNKEDWKMGRKMDPKMRTYAPVIVRGEEEEGVKFWGFGIKIYEELLSIIADPEYGDITDPISGTDFIVEYKTPEEANNSYGMTTIRPKRQQTKLTEDSSQLENWLTNQQEITEIYKEPTYEILKTELTKYVNPEDGENEPVDSAPASNKKTDSVEDVLADFDNLLKDDSKLSDQIIW